jgi:hypothetical protein
MITKRLLVIVLFGMLALGCRPRPCVSPVQGRALPPRPVNRMKVLPSTASLEQVAEAALLDREDRGNYGDSLEQILIALGAIPTPPVQEQK